MRYITYGEMDAFYTISELCELYGVTKDYLKKKSHQYEIYPVKIDGEYGFLKQAACNLHNKIYREEWLQTHGEGTMLPEPENGDLPWL